jgi:cell division protein FtsI (penicillin-binding protein 3)
MDEAFIFSSNIASAQIAVDLGAQKQADFFRKLGFFDPVSLELPELRRPSFPSRWTDISTATAAYGYGMAMTPLHILIAANSIVNFGMSVQPTLLKRDPNEPRRYVQMVSFETAREMKALMERAVVEGTGRRAAGSKASVMGKTGGAYKIVNGAYSPNHMRTFFFSAFPREAPRYTMFIMLDEARNNGCYGASCTAVEVSRRIIDEIEPMLNL